ncbi:hypothetical protein MYSI104531_26365 [Mycobacterium simiae]
MCRECGGGPRSEPKSALPIGHISPSTSRRVNASTSHRIWKSTRWLPTCVTSVTSGMWKCRSRAVAPRCSTTRVWTGQPPCGSTSSLSLVTRGSNGMIQPAGGRDRPNHRYRRRFSRIVVRSSSRGRRNRLGRREKFSPRTSSTKGIGPADHAVCLPTLCDGYAADGLVDRRIRPGRRCSRPPPDRGRAMSQSSSMLRISMMCSIGAQGRPTIPATTCCVACPATIRTRQKLNPARRKRPPSRCSLRRLLITFPRARYPRRRDKTRLRTSIGR